ncbi:Bug family tripartite tricarboxylate transporter substrate binding protein [Pollutimonas bauzanensis]|uniref:Tripartite-type tricarboxylate transporter, receptor component TctC n=1 Tax=Pollutimonas bauzanensis TaxID=658167 RepID=A0A1M5SJB9_9BURK|nr:tripartite tricarboxylate transporter substrate binding protein [Pollutimonas bauzanensis]SHH38358.1 Tripartite-type tricarboxylate transporter, receptor component TctC [Pollutimonas bauzanensis]
MQRSKISISRYACLPGAFRKLGLAAGLALLAATSVAQPKYPSQPVTLVVGFPPGGSNDIVARLIAPKFSQALGVPVIVENKAGANATIGTEYTVRAKPDGYTITLGSASPLAISPHTYKKLPYDPLTDLRAITTVAQTPELIALNPSVPAQTLAELVKLSKSRDITLASAGAGGLPHLAIELLKLESGGRIVHVPYKGASPATADAVGGHVDGIIVDVPALYAQVAAGKLRPIAVTHDKRSSVLPDVPTSVEAGLPKVLAFNWFAVMAPAKTPDNIVDTLYAALVKAANDPGVVEQLAKLGIEPFTQASPAVSAEFMKSETARWGKVAKAANVQTN